MLSFESASYVARYTMKKAGLAKTKREYFDTCEWDEEKKQFVMKTKYQTLKGKIEPEFISMSTSPGIGYEYFIKNQESIIKNNGLLVKTSKGVKIKPIPRYFRKIMEKQSWLKYERWKMNYELKIKKQQEKIINSYALPKNWIFAQKEYFAQKKLLDNIKHKFKLLKRNNILYDVEETEDD